jgi:hypothetical protein
MPPRDALVDLLEWCKSERRNLQRQLEMLTSGKFRIGENRGPSWFDATDASIERATASIDELDQIIAECDRVCKCPEVPTATTDPPT